MTELQTKSGAIKPALLPADLERVRRHFVFRDVDYIFKRPSPVEAFLREHPFLIGLILDAREHIREYFGADCPLALQLFRDPEDNRPELLLVIQTQRSVEDALLLLSRLDEDWWFDASEQADWLVNIMLEYVS